MGAVKGSEHNVLSSGMVVLVVAILVVTRSTQHISDYVVLHCNISDYKRCFQFCIIFPVNLLHVRAGAGKCFTLPEFTKEYMHCVSIDRMISVKAESFCS